MGNAVFYDTSRGSFYEVWYFTSVHRPSGRAFWLRSTLLKTLDDRPDLRGGLWLAMFDPVQPADNFAVRRMVHADDVVFKKGFLDVRIARSSLTEGRYTAEFEAEGRRLGWDLNWAPNEEQLWLIPDIVKRTRIPKADVCVANVDIRLFGEIDVDGEVFRFEDNPAGQSHHWGYHYGKEWLWGHCNEFEGRPGAWLEVLAVKMAQIGPVPIPAVMMSLNTGSERLGIHGPISMFASKAEYDQGVWRYVIEDDGRRAEIEFSAAYENFVKFPYTSPHAENYDCHNCCLCDCRVRVFERLRGRWRQIDELISGGRAAAEYCGRDVSAPDAYNFRGMRRPRFL